ncbi:hypothetical protein PMZ80_001688 [Knufia obscura]|uniref:Uncharacterized protein n=1 Tax=Knufia obscura TaxID=1635080 RepID=A0ABR0S412_9EURO|nr:hypothetical protein PMZ80_001688 [Knufia obscura]
MSNTAKINSLLARIPRNTSPIALLHLDLPLEDRMAIQNLTEATGRPITCVRTNIKRRLQRERRQKLAARQKDNSGQPQPRPQPYVPAYKIFDTTSPLPPQQPKTKKWEPPKPAALPDLPDHATPDGRLAFVNALGHAIIDSWYAMDALSAGVEEEVRDVLTPLFGYTQSRYYKALRRFIPVRKEIGDEEDREVFRRWGRKKMGLDAERDEELFGVDSDEQAEREAFRGRVRGLFEGAEAVMMGPFEEDIGKMLAGSGVGNWGDEEWVEKEDGVKGFMREQL